MARSPTETFTLLMDECCLKKEEMERSSLYFSLYLTDNWSDSVSGVLKTLRHLLSPAILTP
jgi:hypothetical protein